HTARVGAGPIFIALTRSDTSRSAPRWRTTTRRRPLVTVRPDTDRPAVSDRRAAHAARSRLQRVSRRCRHAPDARRRRRGARRACRSIRPALSARHALSRGPTGRYPDAEPEGDFARGLSVTHALAVTPGLEAPGARIGDNEISRSADTAATNAVPRT